MFFLVFLLRLITRRPWLTCAIYVSLFTLNLIVQSPQPLITAVLGGTSNLIFVIVMLRFGLLSTVISTWVYYTAFFANPTADLSTWHSGYMIAAFALVLAVAAFAFRESLGGQKLFKGGLLED